jgi:hypothetical protein
MQATRGLQARDEGRVNNVQVRSEESANRGRGEFKDGARAAQARGEGSASKGRGLCQEGASKGEGGASKERGWCKKGMK